MGESLAAATPQDRAQPSPTRNFIMKELNVPAHFVPYITIGRGALPPAGTSTASVFTLHHGLNFGSGNPIPIRGK